MLVGMHDINWSDFFQRYGLVDQPKKGKRKKSQQRILNVFSAFDIETSTVWLNDNKRLYDVHSFMYVWQMQIEDYTIKGRTWEEWLLFLAVLREGIESVKEKEKLSQNPLLVIWVHNLAYEFTFISGIYPFKNEECFFRDVRKPIYCRMMDSFELRCSYIQTNLSLSALCKQCGVPEKLSGQKYDYDKIRFPWTELTEFEQEYCTRDVESLVQCMKYRVQRSGDTLVTVPLTSTGYVRRECKEALSGEYLNVRELKPLEKEYRLLRNAFRGGNTHANRAYVGRIVEDVYSYDISSSYPTQQLTQLFPMSPFKWLLLDQKTSRERIKKVYTYIGLNYAVIGRYKFKQLRLKNPAEPIPYISLSRCDALRASLDNGRILECEYLEIALTEIDLKIIMEQYTFSEIDITECMVSQKGFLPVAYRHVIQDYYNKKTKLKGDDSEEGLYIYLKSKNMLNSVYGMSATDPIHNDVFYDPDHQSNKEHDGEYYTSDYSDFTSEEIAKRLKNAAFPYSWGVYTTAYARKQLQDAIRLAGDRIVYCDTDSVKLIGPFPELDKLNASLRRKAEQQLAYADDKNGIRHYIGIFEQDAHYDRFITQGAKRYAFEKNGKLGVTVAGVSTKVNEKTGIPFAVEELKSLENFKPDRFDDDGNLIEKGMIWSLAGGTMSVYNDTDDIVYTDPESGNKVHITKNVSIIPTTYEMTYAKDYRLLLEKDIQLYSDYRRLKS